MKKSHSIFVFLIFFTITLTAQQFDVSAELRPRFESKHGYKTLAATDSDAANFVSQRTRINFGFSNENLKAYVSMQNTSIWGDKSTLAAQDNVSGGIGTKLHQAWAEAMFTDKVSLKLGRQEIVYDDHRIFGHVGWAQQARSHDAMILKYKPNSNNKLDVGFALNADSQSGVDNTYSDVAGYKSFQYAWYHGNFNKFGISFLLLNTGKEYEEGEDSKQTVDYMQTIGPRLTYKSGNFNVNAATYFQTGKTFDVDVNALYYTANLGYKINDNFSLGLGYEYLSGKDQNDTDAEIKSFAPLFGTNHKFNGWMDYFYVGNHGGSVGLSDIYATFAYKKGKFSAKIIPHMFSTAASVYDGTNEMDSKLGTEIDITLGYKIAKDITLSAGYSKMLATDTMEILKGGDQDEANSWGWVMFTFKPKLFSHTVK